MKVVSLLCLLNLASTEAAPKDYDGVVSNLRKVADGIDAKKNVLSKKLENIRMMKTQLQELEDSIRKDEKEMDSEKKGIAAQNKDIERKVEVLKFMKENEAESTSDLIAMHKDTKKTLDVERVDLNKEKAKIEKKLSLIEDMKLHHVDSVEGLENAVTRGAQRIGERQAELRNKLQELAQQLEDSQYVH